MNTKVYLDTRRKKSDGKYPVRIVISAHGTTSSITVENVSVMPEYWNGIAVYGCRDAQVINAKIQQKKYDIDRALLLLEDRLKGLSATQVKERVEGYIDPQRTTTPLLSELLKKHTETISKGGGFIYYNTARLVDEYSPGCEIAAIDLKWLEGFDTWLIKNRHKTNSRAIYMKNIRAVYNKAINEGYVTTYPFRRFKIKKEPTAKRSLTLDELRYIYNYEDSRSAVIVFKDYFMLSFFLCGINTVDLSKLKDSDVHNGRIEYKRTKTGRLYSIKIEPEAQALMDKYKGKDGKLLDIMDRNIHHNHFTMSMTNNLRRMGMPRERALRKNASPTFPQITQYWARHSWATLAYELGVPMEVIAQGLGHAYGSQTTSIYIKPNQAKADAANRMIIDAVVKK